MVDTVNIFISDGSFVFEAGCYMRDPFPGERRLVYADEKTGLVYDSEAPGRVFIGELIAYANPLAYVFVRGTGNY